MVLIQDEGRSLDGQVGRSYSSGEYATESEVIRDGLRTLQARDAALEKWLREEVVKSYDDCEADAKLGVPAEQIMARIRSQYHKRTTEEQR